MDGQMTVVAWQQWKEDIRAKLQETKELGSKICNNFVYIGYNLKMAEKTEAYRMDGFDNIYDFAQSEYGLGQSEVSRYKQINDRYSVDGNSLEIREEMREYGLSQLVAMLSIPDEQHSLISPDNTVRQIRELNSFNKGRLPGMSEAVQEELERPAAGVEQTPLQKCIFDFFKDSGRRGLLNEVLERLVQPDAFTEATVRQICDTINPAGNQTHRAGIVFLFMYEYERGIKYKLYTSPRPEEMSWENFLQEIICTYESYLAQDSDEELWCRCYGTVEEPEKVQVAGQMNLEEVQKEQIATSHEKMASDSVNTESEGVMNEPAGSSPEESIPDATYEEIIEEKDNIDAEEKEETAVGDISTADAGEDADSGEGACTGEFSTDEIQEPDESTGAAESGGCKVHSCGVDEEEIWMQCRARLQELDKFFAIWDTDTPNNEECLATMYEDAITLAAGIEKIMIARAQNV